MHDHLLVVAQLSLSQLESCCCDETERWRTTRAERDSPCCLEIFRRALRLVREHPDGRARFDDDACALLVRLYTPLIEARVNASARNRYQVSDITQEAWARFWRRAASDGLVFTTIQQAIRYLQRVTASAIISIAQAEPPEQVQSLDQVTAANEPATPDADPFEDLVKQALLKRLFELTETPLEQTVLLMRYKQGWAPRQIAQALAVTRHPLSEKEIYKILSRLFKRFGRDPTIRDLLE